MSVSRRIKIETDQVADELQAKIVLKKGQKVPKIVIIDRALRFAAKKEKEFMKFLLSLKEEEKKGTDNPLKFILEPVEGGKPEDYMEYDYDDLELSE